MKERRALARVLEAIQRVEGRVIFEPQRSVNERPERYGVACEEVFFDSDDGVRLHGYYVPGTTNKTLLWFHGNAGNNSSRSEEIALFRSHLDANLFLIDYRGFGRSRGVPSEMGVYRDAHAALRHLSARDDVDPDAIAYFGQSLGAAVALELARHARPSALILEGAFTSIVDMARLTAPWIPARLLLRSRFASIDKIGGIEAPVLLLHGALDELVPAWMSEKLYAAAREPKRLCVLERAAHGDLSIVDPDRYFGAIAAFLDPD